MMRGGGGRRENERRGRLCREKEHNVSRCLREQNPNYKKTRRVMTETEEEEDDGNAGKVILKN